jgi:hypothetical protein
MLLNNLSMGLADRRETIAKFPDHIWLVWVCEQIVAGLGELEDFG